MHAWVQVCHVAAHGRSCHSVIARFSWCACLEAQPAAALGHPWWLCGTYGLCMLAEEPRPRKMPTLAVLEAACITALSLGGQAFPQIRKCSNGNMRSEGRHACR
jgi:hypothetical protein